MASRVCADFTQVSTVFASCGRSGDEGNSTFTSRGEGKFTFARGGGGGEISSFLPEVPSGHGWGSRAATLCEAGRG